MKIIRKRKGFTTNSSSTNEWIPGKPTATPSVASGTPATSTSGAGLKAGESITLAPVTEGSPAPESSFFTGNAAKVGGLLGLVALVVALERTVRTLLKRKKKGREE